MAKKGNEIVARLQRRIGTCDDGLFGKNTLKAACEYYHFRSDVGAHFFGQLSVESCNFTVFSENLNYSKKGLLTTFPKYFPTEELAGRYANNPEAIANRVYANRMGNGDESSGDGWKYRGRGAIQLTGYYNYKRFWEWYSEFQGQSGEATFMDRPERVVEEYAFLSAVFFFSERQLFETIAGVSESEIKRVTKLVNGGYNGIEQRIKKTQEYYKILNK